MARNLVDARRRTKRVARIPRATDDYFPFDGGLNLLDSPLSVKPGQLASAINYEIDIAGGYRRIAGYEAYDGSPSPSEATYWKMLAGKDGTDGRLIDRTIDDDIDGATSSATGKYLTATEEGGYGQNAVINSEEFDNSDWDINQTSAPADSLTIADGSISATSDYPKLSLLTDSVDTGTERHRFETATANDISVNEGDIVYVSAYMKATGSTWRINLGIENAPFGHAGTSDPYGQFVTDRSSADSAVNLSSGMYGAESIGNGVYRIWIRSMVASGSASNVKIRISVVNHSTGSDLYQGAGTDVAYIGGIQAVVVSPDDVQNLVEGRTFSGNWSATAGTLGITDGDTAAIMTAYFPDMTRLNDAGSGTQTHRIRSTKTGNVSPIKVKAGDRLYVEWFGMWTTGQIDYQYITPDSVYTTEIFGNLDAFFDIRTGSRSVDSSGSGWSAASITTIGTDHFRVRMLSTVAAVDGEFGFMFGHAVDDGGSPDSTYVSTGLYSHITGFTAVAMPDADGRMSSTAGDTTVHGYAATTTAAVNVKTGSLILGGVSGTFQADEDLEYNSATWAEARSVATENGETDTTLDAAYTALAVSNASAAAAPTGSGAIRGIWEYNGKTYCFRDNTGATAGQMFVETVSGWDLITLNDRLNFDAGTGSKPAEGSTVTGASSGASAPALRVVKTSGTWGVDAAGYIILGTVTSGPFQNNENLQVSAVTFALADGANAAQTLPAGGRYEFRNHNFYGASDKYRMYGVNGVGNAFEYDDASGAAFFCDIETGMTTDTPDHLAVHNQHLFLSFPGGSVQLSGDADPVAWQVVLGAAEIAIGADCTGFNEEVADSLFIFSRNKTFVLQGSTRANFNLDDFNINAGAHEWSIERIGLGCYFDDRGFTTTVQQTQDSGSVNYLENTQSEMVQTLISDLLANTSVVATHLIRNRNIYRCYFADGRVVSIGFRKHKVAGHMVLEYPFVANCAVSGEDTTGAEVIFVGANDGTVYKLETGTSFNGDPLRAFLRTVLYHSRSPSRMKKYAQAKLDAQLFGALSLYGRVEYDNHNDEFNLGDELDFSTDEAGGYWDDFNWDNFTWDKSTSGIPQQKLEGEGTNAAVYLHTESTTDPVHVIRGMSLQWIPHRDDRRN